MTEQPMYDDAHLASLGRLVRQALPRWSFGTNAEIRLLTISENATYLIDEPGHRMVLRVHRPDYHTQPEIASELMWIEALRSSKTVRTPQPIAARDGTLIQTLRHGDGARHAVAFDYVAGKEPNAEDDLPRWFGELGAITARMHDQVRGWQPPASFTRKRWDFDAALGHRLLWGPWRAGLGLDDRGRTLLARAVAVIDRRLKVFGDGPDRFGIVHADLRLANLIVDGDVLTVIDFDDCGFSWYAYDFAAAISFFEHDPIVPELMESWVRGYRTVAAFGPEELAIMPILVMMRRILLTAWIASHAETPTAQAMGIPYTEGTVRLAEDFLQIYG